MPEGYDSPKVNTPTHSRKSNELTQKFTMLATLMSLVVAGYWWFSELLSIENLATKETELRAFYVNHPVWATCIALAFYIVVAGLSFPGAAILTLAYGWYFGFWQGLFVVSFGSTGGATLAFLMTRYLVRNWVQQKFARKLESFNRAFDREGAFYLFTLRLIPAVPFFVINAVMGLTKIRAATFWWVSQIGMLPGTAAYVYAGASVPSLTKIAAEGVGKVIGWQLLLAFVILGLLPLVAKRIVRYYSR
jgi:uncharacterized membrane protein YdjX (TVP38/TMEM64 family)